MSHKNSIQTLSLKDWINEVGVAEVAKLLKVEPSSVRHWRCGRVLPASKQMFRIQKFSKGRVSYESMIDGFHGKKAK